MALSAALPIDWPPLKVYIFITLVFSILDWCGLAGGGLGRHAEKYSERPVHYLQPVDADPRAIRYRNRAVL